LWKFQTPSQSSTNLYKILAEFRPTAATISPAIPNPDATEEENREGVLRIDESNLGADPRSSEAFDVGLAWYNRPGSIVGLNFFTKEVIEIARQSTSGENSAFCNADFISQVDSADAQAEIAGRTTFFDGAGNCRLDSGNGVGPRLLLSQIVNTDPIRVNGIEFQVTQNTDFLDGFWGNFGGTFNYTYTTAESGEGFTLPRVSKNTYNLIGFYETDKFSIRLAQNYRSAYNRLIYPRLIIPKSHFSSKCRHLTLITLYEKSLKGLTFWAVVQITMDAHTPSVFKNVSKGTKIP